MTIQFPDSIFTWRFQAHGGLAWGGTLIADSASHAPGTIFATPHGSYTILTEEPWATDLSVVGLEDGQVFVEWYWDQVAGRFLPTRNGAGLASGSAGLGSEQDAAWTGSAWGAFGLGGLLQTAGDVTATLMRFSWVFESRSGDRWSGVLFADVGSLAVSSTVAGANGVYRITGQAAATGDGAVQAGTVRLSGVYFDSASGREFHIRDDGSNAVHGTAGLGSEVGEAFNGLRWTAFGQGGALEVQPGFLSGPTTQVFGLQDGWNDQTVIPRMLGDVNGDGRADIVAFGNAGPWVALAQADGRFGTPFLGLNDLGLAFGWNDQTVIPRMLGDVNGDGRADIVAFGNAGPWVALAQADGRFGTPFLGLNDLGLAFGWNNQNVIPRMLGDVNGDGRADIVAFGNAGAWVALADATGHFARPVLTLNGFGLSGGWNDQSRVPRMLADVTGDGRAEVIGFGNLGPWLDTLIA